MHINRSLKLTLFPLFIVLYEMSTYLSNDMYLPAMSVLKQEYHVAHYGLQSTLMYWFLGSAAFQLFLGPLSDRYGRRPVLFTGGVCFVMANGLAAITTSFSLFLLARFFQGAAVCSVVVAGYAAVHESFDHLKAIKVTAIMGCFTLIAPAYGPFLGALIMQVSSWRWIFAVLAVWAAVMLLLLSAVMPETSPCRASSMRQTLKQYRDIVLNKTFTGHMLSLCFAFAGLIAWVSGGPELIITDLGKSPMTYAAYQAIIFASFVLAAFSVRILIEKFSVAQVIRAGFAIVLTASAILAVLVLFDSLSETRFIAGLSLFAFAVGLLFSTVQRAAVESCQQEMGLVMAVFFTGVGVLCIVASSLVMVFYQESISSLALIIAGLGGVAALIGFGHVRWVASATHLTKY